MTLSFFWSNKLTLRNVMFVAAMLRISLIIYGDYHDRHSDLKYTDVDYKVFSDASRFLSRRSDGNAARGVLPRMLSWDLGDPYSRSTYRYTPLLALLTLPNEFVHPAFGKALFAFCDLLVGYLLYLTFLQVIADPPPPNSEPVTKNPAPPILNAETMRQRRAVAWVSALWLLNPMVANISTRGSAESVLGAMVVSSLYLLLSSRLEWAAVLFGLSVHFKIYPIIYGASTIAWIDRHTSLNFSVSSITKKRMRFFTISALTFLLLNAVMFCFWGHPFLEHTYLYHLTRRDHRHNFSPYFYPMYIGHTSSPSSAPSWSSQLLGNPLLSFLPQMALCVMAGFALGRSDLPFAWFVQTAIFVTFNKVCTSQYFMWYIWFLPVVLPRLSISLKRALLITCVWVISQAIWLASAYRLELLGESVYVWVWAASVVFLVSNGFVLGEIMKTFAFNA
ncbi:phosphatidylinositol glycan, class M [Ceratobasidium sp. AG-Ba]|nr:phosphatidylinositol glycan, class M [Ceratobasidium sp. AG-Ba]QRW15272.1 phosphatidylinositol glycan, class M [Ceratobasidium sp. AG-Ba]